MKVNFTEKRKKFWRSKSTAKKLFEKLETRNVQEQFMKVNFTEKCRKFWRSKSEIFQDKLFTFLARENKTRKNNRHKDCNCCESFC